MRIKLPSQILAEKQKETSVSTARRIAENWFEELYIDKKSDPIEEFYGQYLEEGKMYTYNYDPKYAKELDFYDNQPIMLCLGHIKTQDGHNAFGINISYIPPKLRIQVLDKFVKIFRTRYIKDNVQRLEKGNRNLTKIPFTYDIAKKILSGSGFEFALRSYIYKRIKTEPMIITYEDWYQPAQFPSKFIQKVNIKAIYMRYKKQFSSEYRIGKKDPKVKISKVKIKDINDYIKNKEDETK